MQTTGRRVLIRHALQQAKQGSLYIPDKFRGTADEGVVIDIGSAVVNSELEVGDRVLFTKRAGVVVKIGERRLRLLNHDTDNAAKDDVLAIMDTGRVELCPTCNGQGTVVDAEENQ